jgi:hypothetical protein
MLGAAGIAVAATGRDRHEAIYPSQRIPIEFSHRLHLEHGPNEAAIGCDGCHGDANGSVKASDLLLPKVEPLKPGKDKSGPWWPDHDNCTSACHDIETAEAGKPVDPASSCETCHLGFDRKKKKVAPASWPTPNLIFNHKVHLDQKGVTCERCHFGASGVGMEQVELSTRYQLPKMKTCLECHNGGSAPSDCKVCHVTDPSGRLQVSFSTATLRPMQGDPLGLDHGPRYEFTHGTRAKLDRRTCGDCHTDSYCATCHDSLQKPISVHPNDFITLHPLQAKMDSLQCDACHRYQSFCASCHERVGIGLNSDPTLRARNMGVHGDATEFNDFVNNRGPRHHAIAAARNINQCIACHREESCTKCHTSASRPQSQSINPHPSGFGSRCRALRAANDRG